MKCQENGITSLKVFISTEVKRKLVSRRELFINLTKDFEIWQQCFSLFIVFFGLICISPASVIHDKTACYRSRTLL